MNQSVDTLVMPNVRAGCHKQTLIRPLRRVSINLNPLLVIELTNTEPKHIEHSRQPAKSSASLPLPRFLIRVSVFLLHPFSKDNISICMTNVLELIGLLLPAAVALNTDAHAAENHLFSSAEINAQLHDISIPNGIQPRHHVRLA